MQKNQMMALVAVAVVIMLVAGSVIVLSLSSSGATVPSKPLSVQATRGDAQIALSWQPPGDKGSSNLIGYKIYKGTSQSSLNIIINLDVQTAYIDTGLTNGVPYYYQISAVNNAGEGAKSNVTTATPSASPATIPGAVRDLSATAGVGSVTLTWDAPLDNGGATISGYEVYWGKTPGSLSNHSLVGYVLTNLINGLEYNRTYYFAVSAINHVGVGEKSTTSGIPTRIGALNIGYVSTSSAGYVWGGSPSFYFRSIFSFETLIAQDSSGNCVPRLADNWSTTDSATWIFHLSHNATWQDGERFTSADVNFTINYLVAHNVWSGSLAVFYSGVNAIRVMDEYTIEIVLKSPNSNFYTYLMSLPIFPEHIWKTIDNPLQYSAANGTIGTGPYVFKSYDRDARILTYEAYDHYYRGNPSVQTIKIKLYGTNDVMILALEKGEIDVTYTYSDGIPYYYVSDILKNTNLGVMTMASEGIFPTLFFNTTKAPWNNVTMRMAVANAIDYKELKNLCVGGFGSVAEKGLVPEAVLYHLNTTALTQNQTFSKKLLTSLGYVDIDADGYREYPNGSKFMPNLCFAAASNSKQAELLKGYLNAVGINVVVKQRPVDWTLASFRSNDMLLLSNYYYYSTYAYDGYAVYLIDGDVGSGHLGYSSVYDAAFTAIMQQLKTATTPEQRQAAAYAVQQYYANNLPALALYWSDLIQPYNLKYHGYQFDPKWGIMCYGTFFNLKLA